MNPRDPFMVSIASKFNVNYDSLKLAPPSLRAYDGQRPATLGARFPANQGAEIQVPVMNIIVHVSRQNQIRTPENVFFPGNRGNSSPGISPPSSRGMEKIEPRNAKMPDAGTRPAASAAKPTRPGSPG
jgi:hypothetical protein